jgi:hypothetical protein
MKKIQYVLISLVVLSLVLTSCGNQEETTGKSPFVGGTNALNMKFMDSQPPATIFDRGQMPFAISVILENRGEHFIFEDGSDFPDFGRLSILGISPSDFGVTQDDLVYDFEENGISIPSNRLIPSGGSHLKGGVSTITISPDPPFNYQPALTGIHELEIGMDLCYNYRTKVSSNLCIVSDIMTHDRRVCEPQGSKKVSNSGGPVHVTSITQAFAGRNKISLMIEVSQVDMTGTVFKLVDPNVPKTEKVCNTAPTNIDKNKVSVEVSLPNEDLDVTCSEFNNQAEGIITLFEGQPKMFVCSIDVSGINQDYVSPIYINLDYAYGQYIRKPIKVQPIN